MNTAMGYLMMGVGCLMMACGIVIFVIGATEVFG
jgi:hypothetical protein